jgi:hypothetical protein
MENLTQHKEPIMTTCEALRPAQNFEALNQCENPAQVEVLYVGGKLAHYCAGCSKDSIALAGFFGGADGKVRFARHI